MTELATYTNDELIRLTIEGRFDEVAPIVREFSLDRTREFAAEVFRLRAEIKKVEQLGHYLPVSPRALQIHLAREKEVIITGGNRSAKSDSILADTIICMTGIIPLCFRPESPSFICEYPKEKLQCPMRVRLVCESLTNTWEPVIKPKLQWHVWNGRGEPGGRWGHWGWIPPRFLFKGKWEESWSEKNRVLTLTCGCTLRVMSYDQDIGDFGGASIHRVIHDEPPPNDIYRENFMRTIDTGGQIYSGFTPSDDPGRALRGSWIYELYERGLDGPGKDPDVKAITLYTEENKILEASEIEKIKKGLTAAEQEVRLRGGFMHLTGKIYPTYTDVPRTWCFRCHKITIAAPSYSPFDIGKKICATCSGNQIVEYCNFIDPDPRWYKNPIVYVIDPHPRKGNMMCWISVNVLDDACLIANKEINADAAIVRDEILPFERALGLNVVCRLMDPKMAGQVNGREGRRQITYRDAFDAVGLRCKLADSNFEIGKDKVADLLHPDQHTHKPRFSIFSTCHLPNRQMKNYVWDEYAHADNTKDVKGTPIAANDDYPTMIKYFANEGFRYSSLSMAGRPMQASKHKRTGAY